MIQKTLFFLLVLFLLLLGGWAVFFSSERGLLIFQSTINRFGGEMVSVAGVEGSFSGGFRLHDIRLQGDQADITVQQVDVSWRPAQLLKMELSLTKIAMAGVRIILKDTPLKQPATLSPRGVVPDIAFPFSLLVESLVINGMKVVDNKRQELFAVDKLSASVTGNKERIAFKSFDLEGPDIGLSVHGNIEVQNKLHLDLLGHWRLAGYGFYPMAGTFSTSGPLTDPHVEIGIHSHGSIRVRGEFVDLLGAAKWTAKVTAQNVDLSRLIKYCPKIELDAVSGDLSGDFSGYRGHVEADGAWDSLTQMHLSSDIDGDGWGIDFPSLRIDGQDRSAQAIGGKISWRDIFSWEGRFLFNNFDPSVITEVLQGRLDAEFVNKGDVKENGVIASFAVTHLEGLLRDHQVSATGNVLLDETKVHTEGLTLRSGEVSGLAYIEQAAFSWAKQPSWSAKVRLENFDPSWLYAEFPGSINGIFATEGGFGEDGLTGSLNIQKISGTLRGNKLSGGGEIGLSHNMLNSPGLAIQSGASQFAIKGQAGDSLALDFSFFSPDISTLVPESAGSVSLSGRLQGRRNVPLLDAEFYGRGLRYQDNQLGLMEAKINTDLSGKGQFTGLLAGEKIVFGGLLLDRGTIEMGGTLANHTIDIAAAGPPGRIMGHVKAGYGDTWQGELSSLQVVTNNFGIWQQQQKTAVYSDKKSILLDNICLRNGESSACLEGKVEPVKDMSWQLRSKVSSLPLEWLNRLQLIPVPVSGLLHAAVTAHGDSRGLVRARLDSRVSADVLQKKAIDSEQGPFYFAGSVFSLTLADSVARAHGDIRLRNNSQVIVNVEVAGAGGFSTAHALLPVHGQLELRRFNLASLTAFTDYGVEPSGLVNSTFTIAGTVGQAEIYGTAAIDDGGIDLPYQGITLENVVVSIQAAEDSAKITGTATSGPGKLTAGGILRYGTKGVEGTVSIHGSDFLLVNLPEYTFRVNPDVVVHFAPDRYAVRGTIDVPYGLITPEQMTGSITASEDVVLVNGTEEEQLVGWPVQLNIKVRLGDEVHIDGYGLAGRLGGQLMVSTTADNIVAGRGELDLYDGTFTIYGRPLSIARGRMLFTGGPVDNPGVDVRAQVKVEDEKTWGAGYTVGVDISGLVQDLEYHLFSDPYMEETEILSLMLVGHSLAGSTHSEGSLLEAAAVTLGVQGSGSLVKKIGSLLYLDDLHLEGSNTREDVSLVVGKRLTKDLYIGYDLNMFSQLGQFRVRYDLTHGFSVETRSSSASIGTDLLYSFEK